MPNFKTTITHKPTADVKAGEEIKLEGIEVEVPQEQVDALVKERLKRQEDKHRSDLAEQEKKLRDELAGKGGEKGDPEVAKKLQAVQDELAVAKAEKALDTELKALGAGDLDPLFKDRIVLKPGMTADEIKDAATAAIAQRDDYNKRHGIEPGKGGAGGDKGAPPPAGFSGAGGSLDKNELSALGELETKFKTARPQDRGLLPADPKAKLKYLRDLDARGLLTKK